MQDWTWLVVDFCRHKNRAQPRLAVLQLQDMAPAFKSLAE